MTSRLTFVSICFSMLPAAALAQVKIEWNLAEKDSFQVEETAVITQKLHLREEVIDQRYEHTIISRFEVKEKKDGALLLEQRILKVKAQQGDKAVSSKLEGATLLFTLDARFRITAMDGFDKLVGQLGDGGVRQALTPESLRHSVDMLFAFLPDKEVGAGASWHGGSTMPFGPLGMFDCKNTYTLKQDRPADAIEIAQEAVGSFLAAPAERLKQMKLTSVRVRHFTAAGTLVFDVPRGRLRSAESKQQIDGTMSLALPNPVDMGFTQRREFKLRIQ